jgi:uncharacterized membrane protein
MHHGSLVDRVFGQSPHDAGRDRSHVARGLVAYLVSLVAAAILLRLFKQGGPATPRKVTLPHIVVLGLPVTIGGATGRLVL